MKTTYILVLLSIVHFSVFSAAQDLNITIPLNKTLIYDDREVYGQYITLNGATTLEVNFKNVNKNISFIVFQAHTHIYDITLNSTSAKSQVTGTNVGLVSFTEPKLDTFYVQNSNVNITLRIYISVHGYTKKDPIPGGCNNEFSVPIAPYLLTEVNNDYITVDGAAPSVDPNCAKFNNATTTFYMMYLPEMNFDADVYFDGIRKMMAIKNILDNGWVVHIQNPLSQMRRMLSAYPGTGSVYVAVANIDHDHYAVYVPTYTYACTPVEGDTCEFVDDLVSQMLCVVLFFIGIFTCFFGHRFFKTEMFLAGFFFGVILTYILIAKITIAERPALLAASTLSGLFFGSIWLLFWWLYGIPVIAVLLPSLHLGFLLSSIFFYRMPAIHLILDKTLNFWCMFILVMLLTALTLISVTYATNILCCSVLGAYAAVYAFDFYLGSSLKYIVINVIRRAVVPKFKWAMLAPPFQWRDIIVTLLWVALATSGFLFQHYSNRGRPPFPPPPRNTRLSVPEARMYGAIGNQTSRREEGQDKDESPYPSTYDERTPLLS